MSTCTIINTALNVSLTCSPGIAYDTVDFCISNLEKLCNSTSILTKYFPNLLKVNGLESMIRNQ